MAVGLKRFEVHLVCLDPTVGTEIKKTRPCLIISPDEMNAYLRTVIVAPMTTRRHALPMRVSCRFQGKNAEVVLDQLRTVDRARLIKRLGRLRPKASAQVLEVLQEMFAP